MPHILFSSLPRLGVSGARREEVLRHDEQGVEVGPAEIVVHNGDMDFFRDEYISTNAEARNYTAASAGECAETEEMRIPPQITVQSARHRESYQQKDLAVDCDVCMQLSGGGGEGNRGTFSICISSALPIPTFSPSDALPPTNEADTHHVTQKCGTGGMMVVGGAEEEDVEEEEAAAVVSNATWVGRGDRSMKYEETNEDEDNDDGGGAAGAGVACSPFYGSKNNVQLGSIMQKHMIMPTNYPLRLIHTGGIPVSVSAERGGGNDHVVYSMKLPPNFALGLRLPMKLERALVEYFGDKNTSTTTATIFSSAPPVWLSSFLHTNSLRSRAFVTSIPTALSPSMSSGGWLEESTAVMTLEGLCIVALNIIAQMGHLHRQRVQESDKMDETNLAQRGLLDEGALFSASQKERVRRWLQRYIPIEAYDGSEEIETNLQTPHGSFSWPSAVTIVFYIALDLAQLLFPSLLLNLESTILAALQPLLEARTVKSMLTTTSTTTTSLCSSQFPLPYSSSCTPSLCFPRSRRQAVVLLAQGPSVWWSWWSQDRNDEKNNSPCNISAISASRGYAALRILQCFMFIHPPSTLDKSCNLGVEEGRGSGDNDEKEEEYELAQFLLSAPTLFTELLLDREVTVTLERTVKDITQLHYIYLERTNGQDMIAVPMQVKHALIRCFLVLVSWLTFRTGGYSSTLAPQHFGPILYIANLYCEQSRRTEVQNTSPIEGNEEDHEKDLLPVCGSEFCSMLSSLLYRLRDRCGCRAYRGNYGSTSGENPWKKLRHGKMTDSKLFFIEEDRATSTSYSHHSVNSFLSNNNGSNNPPSEGDIAPQPTMVPSRATRLDNDVFQSHLRHTLRGVIRKVRLVLQKLKQDMFVEEHVASVSSTLGAKRHRSGKDRESSLTHRGSGLRFGVSPQFACYVHGQTQRRSVWGWQLEHSDSSDDEATGTSTSESG